MAEARAERWRGGLILVVCVLVAHAGSLRNGFHYDDEHSLLENPHVRSLADPGCFSGMPEARMYRPLVLATYALNYAAGGYAPPGYHLVNLVLHLLVCLASWRLFRILVPDSGAALIAALVLGLHPLCTEPVSYVSARSSVLATLFVVLGMWVLVRQATALRPGRTVAFLAACQLAALGAKEIGVVLPLLGAVWLVSRPRSMIVVNSDGPDSTASVGRSARPWVLLAAPAAVCLVYLIATRAILGKAILEPVRPLAVQTATQLKAAGFYLWKVAAPFHLSVEPQFRAASVPVEAAGVVALLLAGSLLWLAARQRHRNPTVWLGCCWFGLALLPSSLVPLNVLVNEHRLYLPLVGAALALAGLLAAAPSRARRLLWPVLALFGLLCVQRHPVWQSGERLWADAVAQGPRMPRPYVNLGKVYLESGRLREAIAISRHALDLDPGLARAHYNIGTAHLRLSEPDLAVADYRRALELQPDLVPALHNLGTAFQEQGLFRQAVVAYRQALALQPT
ncbi:MAG: tetratricopeptide repeat protein, partial [Candidatus Latescibacterota bacterium]